MAETVIKIEGLKKQYRLGAIGGTTLNAELQSWWARKRGKEDPNLKLGQDYSNYNETFWALNGINVEVKRGEKLGVIGANGAGKSTLLKILSRVTAPTEGTIKINGRISSMLEVGTGFHGELTGRENIYMNGAILGMSKKEVDRKISDIIEFSECEQFIDTPVKRYSSGMYVKLAFAVASNLDSEILIMDEVLAVGDMKFQKKCLGKMNSVAEREGKTVLYVSHNMNTIRQLCQRCIVLSQGRVIYDGDVESAISVYLNRMGEELPTTYFCKDLKRNGSQFGQKVLIHSFGFLDKKEARFSTTERMRFKIAWEAFENVDNLKVRFAVKYIDSTNIGMAESKVFVHAQAGGKYKSEFEADLSNLTGGLYYLKAFLFDTDIAGHKRDLDAAMAEIYFEIVEEEENKTVWLQQYWGNVRLNEINHISSFTD